MEIARIDTIKDPAKKAEQIAALKKFVEDMKADLESSDPAVRKQAMDYMAGSLVLFGKEGSLGIASDKWMGIQRKPDGSVDTEKNPKA
jgi:hypothetical protein